MRDGRLEVAGGIDSCGPPKKKKKKNNATRACWIGRYLRFEV
jgi:hypothetical protein